MTLESQGLFLEYKEQLCCVYPYIMMAGTLVFNCSLLETSALFAPPTANTISRALHLAYDT